MPLPNFSPLSPRQSGISWRRIVLWGAVTAGLSLVVFLGALTWHFSSLISAGYGPDLAKQFTSLPVQTAKVGVAASLEAVRVALETKTSPYRGNPVAPITIVEFVDFKCPNCRSAAPIMRQVLDKYPGQVQLIVRHFPIESLHPGAGEVNRLAWCATEQGAFWKAHDLLLDKQDSFGASFSTDDIALIADQIGVDDTKLTSCFNDGRSEVAVSDDFSLGVKYGVRGTPTFFVNGQKVEGVVSLDSWAKIIASLSKF